MTSGKANSKVWYITGASKGLGLALTKKLLAMGYCVASTSRNKDQLINAVNIQSDDFFPIEVDLTDKSSVDASVKKVIEKFGRIDVVVNNAGYGMGGTVEEFSEAELKRSFDINVFAPVYVMQAALPFMRERKSGYIINISSIAGFAPATGWAIYAATKFALSGLTEVLGQDLKEFGIHTTTVSPGAFRTDFLKDTSVVFTAHEIPAYTSVRSSHKRYKDMDGQQAGDPEKAADVFIRLSEMSDVPPPSLYLGSDAFRRGKARLEQIDSSLEQFKDVSFSTDY